MKKNNIFQRLRIISIWSILLFALSVSATSALTQQGKDAISMRVIPNPERYSVMKWYQKQGFKGSPQATKVDGYDAVRDGQTVYVNAANIAGEKLYTNIYVITYNLGASAQTSAIFDSILAHWKFNANLSYAADSCAIATKASCLMDNDCPRGDYCKSLKARTIRDVKRLADFSDIHDLLAKYKANNGGVSYPRLQSGSYLTDRTISVWPSWQATLGSQLGGQLPVDPINRLGECNTVISKDGSAGTAIEGAKFPTSGNAIYANANVTLKYDFTVTAKANYLLEISTANHINGPEGVALDSVSPSVADPYCPGPGFKHHLSIFVDDVKKGELCQDAVSSTTPEIGQIPLGIATTGVHTIKISWDNQQDSGPYSTKLQVKNVKLKSLEYNPTTCWSEDAKRYAATSDPLSAPLGSRAYMYEARQNGKSYSLTAPMESGYVREEEGASATSDARAETTAHANRAPIFELVNFSNGVATTAYAGDIQWYDQDNDPVTASMKYCNNASCSSSSMSPTVGGWNSWNSPTFRPATGRRYSFTAAKAAGEGSYFLKITLNDLQNQPDSSVSKIIEVKILKSGSVIEGPNEINLIASATKPISAKWKITDMTTSYPLSLPGSLLSVLQSLFGMSADEQLSRKNDLYEYIWNLPGVKPQAIIGKKTVELILKIKNKLNVEIQKKITLNITNTAPDLQVNCPDVIRVGEIFSCPVTTTDAEGNSVTLSYEGNHPNLNLKSDIDTSRTVQNTPMAAGSASSTEYSFKIKAIDQFNASTTRTISIKVNDYCGDGTVQNPTNMEGVKEECEKYGNGTSKDDQWDCTINPRPGISGVSLPNTPCRWFGGWCGDGLVASPYEVCDGNIGHGTGTSAADQYFCDCISAGGWCGDSLVQDGTGGTTDYDEDCDKKSYVPPTSPPESNANRHYACDSSCKFEGGYCGDGTIQPDRGEICETGQTQPCTSTVGIELPAHCEGAVFAGVKTCGNDCTWGSCQIPPPVAVPYSEGKCDPFTITLNDWACCEITACVSDAVLGCCGNAKISPVTEGYDNVTSLPYDPGDCKLNKQSGSLRNWEITGNHTVASYQCWR